MNRRTVAFMCLICLVASSATQGQTFTAPPSTLPPTSESFAGASRVSDLINQPSGMGWALLDPSRFHMRQSYSISYISGSGGSGSVGLYTNNLEYQLFKPLTLHVGLGYLHQPFGSRGANSEGVSVDDGFFIPSAGLEYRPSDKFLLMVDFRQYPSGTAPYYGRWGYGWTPYSNSLFSPW